MAAASFAKLKKIWSEKNNKMSLPKRLRLYNAYVMPVLTYNSSTWALSDTEEDAIDSFRRRQLRIVIGVRYPRKIPSKELYKQTNTIELKHIIRKNSTVGRMLPRQTKNNVTWCIEQRLRTRKSASRQAVIETSANGAKDNKRFRET